MDVLIRNREYMFTIFGHDGQHYLTVVTGGVYQYEVTIKIEDNELNDLREDEAKQVRLSKLVAAKPEAFETRQVRLPFSP